MTYISPEIERQRIIDALEKAGANQPCPRCRNQSFGVVDGLVNQQLNLNVRGAMFPTDSIPSIVTVCTKCGFIAQHSIGVLGLVEQR